MDRRTEILEATCRVIARDGAYGLRMADVAREAGVSNALVHYYVPTRQELLAEAFDFANDRAELELQDRLDPGASAVERLAAALTLEFEDGHVVRESWALWNELWSRRRARPVAAPARGAGLPALARGDRGAGARGGRRVRPGGHDGAPRSARRRPRLEVLVGILSPSRAGELLRAAIDSGARRHEHGGGTVSTVRAGAGGDGAGRAGRPALHAAGPCVHRPRDLRARAPRGLRPGLDDGLPRLARRRAGPVPRRSSSPASPSPCCATTTACCARCRTSAATARSTILSGHAATCPKVLRCPYHGWTYRQDGQLAAVPEARGFAASTARPCACRLPGGRAARPGVRLPRPDTEPLDEFLGELGPRLGPLGIGNLVPPSSRTSPTTTHNWKVIADNYLEGYHIPVGHPEPAAAARLQALRGRPSACRHAWIDGPFRDKPSKHRLRAPLPAPAAADAPASPRSCATPGRTCTSCRRRSSTSTRTRSTPGTSAAGSGRAAHARRSSMVYRAGRASRCASALVRRLNWKINDLVMDEDVELCDGVQEGLESLDLRARRAERRNENAGRELPRPAARGRCPASTTRDLTCDGSPVPALQPRAGRALAFFLTPEMERLAPALLGRAGAGAAGTHGQRRRRGRGAARRAQPGPHRRPRGFAQFRRCRTLLEWRRCTGRRRRPAVHRLALILLAQQYLLAPAVVDPVPAEDAELARLRGARPHHPPEQPADPPAHHRHRRCAHRAVRCAGRQAAPGSARALLRRAGRLRALGHGGADAATCWPAAGTSSACIRQAPGSASSRAVRRWPRPTRRPTSGAACSARRTPSPPSRTRSPPARGTSSCPASASSPAPRASPCARASPSCCWPTTPPCVARTAWGCVPGAPSPWIGTVLASVRRAPSASLVAVGLDRRGAGRHGPAGGLRGDRLERQRVGRRRRRLARLLRRRPGDARDRPVARGVAPPGRVRGRPGRRPRRASRSSSLKVGAERRRRRTALAHSGAIAGSDRAFDALCRAYGAVRGAGLRRLAGAPRGLRLPAGARPARASSASRTRAARASTPPTWRSAPASRCAAAGRPRGGSSTPLALPRRRRTPSTTGRSPSTRRSSRAPSACARAHPEVDGVLLNVDQ